MADALPTPGLARAERASHRRFLMAVVFQLAFGVLAIGAAPLVGLSPRPGFVYLAAVGLVAVVFHLVFRRQWNRRLREPGMTVPQLLIAIPLLLYVQYHAGAYRQLVDNALIVALMFGCFILRGRQFVALMAYMLLGKLAVLGLLAVQGRLGDFRHELLIFVGLAITLGYLVVLGVNISNLRRRLSQRKAELRSALATIEKLAIFDELTGIHNRRALLAQLNEEKQRAERYREPFSVCYLDIDLFKRINDTFGHAAGDEVLRTVAAGLREQLRDIDRVGRFGGEEFVIALAGTPLAEAEACAERIRQHLRSWPQPALDGEPVTLSIGVAQYHPGETLEQLLDRADRALYRAKQGGRDRVELALLPAQRVSVAGN